MELLLEHDLYCDEVFQISTEEMRERYNRCLDYANVAPTTLKEFSIDGAGWSPQVAEEKGDLDYLGHGDAYPVAILLSPDQARLPLYNAYNSFDEIILKKFFEDYRSEIADITLSDGICLEFDRGFTRLNNPRDLLLIDSISAKPWIGDLRQRSRRQRELLDKLHSEPLACFQAELREQIIVSARTDGDLRSRRVEIAELEFDDLGSFSTRAFGGAFLLRNPYRFGIDGKPIQLLVLEALDANTSVSLETLDILPLKAEPLLDYLIEMGLVEIDLSIYYQQQEMLKVVYDMHRFDCLCELNKDFDPSRMSELELRKLEKTHASEFPESLHELEQLMNSLERGNLPQARELSLDLQRILAHPNSQLDQSDATVVWRLLYSLSPIDHASIFDLDRRFFMQLYQSWPQSRRALAVHRILEAKKRKGES